MISTILPTITLGVCIIACAELSKTEGEYCDMREKFCREYTRWDEGKPPIHLLGTTVYADQSGYYGVAVAAVGMLATLAISLSTDAYGPIADNAGGLAEMSHLGPEVRAKTDSLDALGNTTAAIGKGFAVGSAVLTALSLLAAFKEKVDPVVHAKITRKEAPVGVEAMDFDVS